MAPDTWRRAECLPFPEQAQLLQEPVLTARVELTIREAVQELAVQVLSTITAAPTTITPAVIHAAIRAVIPAELITTTHHQVIPEVIATATVSHVAAPIVEAAVADQEEVELLCVAVAVEAAAAVVVGKILTAR